MSENIKTVSDAAWYFTKDPEAERYYEIFFRLCRKYNVSWASASAKERAFIEEVARVTYEHDRSARLGEPVSSIRPAFSY